MDYKQATALYLDAVWYRAKLERRCTQNGVWVIGTFALLYLELKKYAPGVGALDVDAMKRFQQVVEVARTYFKEQPDSVQVADIVNLVSLTMGQAIERARQSSTRAFVKGREDEMRIFFLASEKMYADLSQIDPGM